jgi:hypothetical protein
MTLPKNKRRTITVDGVQYYWYSASERRMDKVSAEKFDEIKKMSIEKNPALKNKRFGITLEKGEMTLFYATRLYIESADKDGTEIKLFFEDREILGNAAKWEHLLISPAVVSAVIRYLAKERAGKKTELRNGAELFAEELKNALQKEWKKNKD